MPDRTDQNPRVGVYIDFDNVVISRYDQVHGERRDAWRADRVKELSARAEPDPDIAARLERAQVDVGALLDYATSYGRVAFARAYADWSIPVNASYQRQLVDRAVDLTQLFPVSGTKNGADIRLSVDAIDDLMRYDDITHVVLVAGDSDYIALAQRCKQLGRYVVGIGVSGSTSRALVAACDEFTSYDDVPGVPPIPPPSTAAEAATTGQKAPAARTTTKKAAAKKVAAEKTVPEKTTAAKATARRSTGRGAGKDEVAQGGSSAGKPKWDTADERQQSATSLLVRALDLASGQAADASGWLFGGGLKSLMQRMDPEFKEKSLGFKTFTAFVESRGDLVESRIDGGGQLRLRLRA